MSAGPASSSVIGKKTSGSTPKQAARSCQIVGGCGVRREGADVDVREPLDPHCGSSPSERSRGRDISRGDRFIAERAGVGGRGRRQASAQRRPRDSKWPERASPTSRQGTVDRRPAVASGRIAAAQRDAPARPCRRRSSSAALVTVPASAPSAATTDAARRHRCVTSQVQQDPGWMPEVANAGDRLLAEEAPLRGVDRRVEAGLRRHGRLVEVDAQAGPAAADPPDLGRVAPDELRPSERRRAASSSHAVPQDRTVEVPEALDGIVADPGSAIRRRVADRSRRARRRTRARTGPARRRLGAGDRILQQRDALVGARRRARLRGCGRWARAAASGAPVRVASEATSAVTRSFSHRGRRRPRPAPRGSREVERRTPLRQGASSSAGASRERSTPLASGYRRRGRSADAARHERLPAARRRDPAHARGARRGSCLPNASSVFCPATRRRRASTRRRYRMLRQPERFLWPTPDVGGACAARCARPAPRSCCSAPRIRSRCRAAARARRGAVPGGRARLRVLAVDRAGDPRADARATSRRPACR